MSPRRYVCDSRLVRTLTPVDAPVPDMAALIEMTLERGTSISTATVADLTALMPALAPHLPTPRLKGLIEATSYQKIACMMANQRPSAFGMVAQERALRLAAVAGLVMSGLVMSGLVMSGLVMSGTTDPVRTRTIAEAGSARQERAGGSQGVAPGMMADQAADALKLGGTERAEALADHARLLGAAGA